MSGNAYNTPSRDDAMAAILHASARKMFVHYSTFSGPPRSTVGQSPRLAVRTAESQIIQHV